MAATTVANRKARRPAGRDALLEAVDALPGSDLLAYSNDVARRMPVPTSTEVIAIRLRDTDGRRLFHLVAIEGASPRERRARALNPLSLAAVKTLAALGIEHTLARALGLRWQEVSWIQTGDEPVGMLVAGSRTDRRPGEQGRRLIADICDRLGKKLRGVDRTESALMDTSRRIAREAAVIADTLSSDLDTLRPRERIIIALYVEGLSVDEIAQLLVISPHTVRTHIKNAFRRLGVHSRDEAAQLLFADEVRRLL